MGITVVIPARYDSSRFPGKPLAIIAGRPMVERVYRRVRQARLPDEVCVATDDVRIEQAVKEFGGRVIMTRRPASSGTDRVAEAAEQLEADVVVNVQGDEPLIDPAAVDQVIEALLEEPELAVATLAYPLASREDLERPDVVKVVLDARGNALYFSRAPIPHGPHDGGSPGLKHLGLYGFRRQTLLAFSGWEPTPLESRERLEQLRLLEHGVRVKVLVAASDSCAVDRPEDIQEVERLLSAGG